jgi:hypothetical protein
MIEIVDYGDCWVCQDCYFAHHYGAHQEEYDVEIYGDDGSGPHFHRALPLWFAGEDDEPVGGWHEIRHNHTLDHNREPLGLIEDDVDVADNTCSNHTWDREMECPVCDDGVAAWLPTDGLTLEYDWPNGYPALCWVCGGSGEIEETCPHCGRDGDENGIQEFSWSRCHGCGSPLGGSRYRLHLFRRERSNA